MVKKHRKEQHLPNSCLQTAVEHKESTHRENSKEKRAFSQHSKQKCWPKAPVFLFSQDSPRQFADTSQVGVKMILYFEIKIYIYFFIPLSKFLETILYFLAFWCYTTRDVVNKWCQIRLYLIESSTYKNVESLICLF